MTYRMIWGALLMSQFMFLFLVLNQPPSETPGESFDLSQSQALNFVTVAVLFAALVVPKFLLKAAALHKRKIVGEKIAPDQFLQIYFVPFLLRLAMTEFITLLGFLQAQRASDPSKLYPNIAVAVIIFLLNFPSQAHFDKALATVNGQ